MRCCKVKEKRYNKYKVCDVSTAKTCDLRLICDTPIFFFEKLEPRNKCRSTQVLVTICWQSFTERFTTFSALLRLCKYILYPLPSHQFIRLSRFMNALFFGSNFIHIHRFIFIHPAALFRFWIKNFFFPKNLFLLLFYSLVFLT